MTATLLAPLGASTARAQGSIPLACLDDRGNLPAPAPQLGAWTMVLNFNHPPSALGTTGCRIMTVQEFPQQLSYTAVPCTVQNNVDTVLIGAGSAPFDGNFWIECPLGPQPPNTGPDYNSFYVFGRASFSTAGSSHTVFQHQDVEVHVAVDENWHLEFDSRYGNGAFAGTDTATDVEGNIVHFSSQVRAQGAGGMGAHFVSGTRIQSPVPLNSFPFDFNKTFTVGNLGELWTLYEVIADPPPRCCNPN